LGFEEGRIVPSASCFAVLKELKTNEKGEYAVTYLDDLGPWVLSAATPSGAQQTFYPSAGDPLAAERVVVEAGSEFWNMDIRLSSGPAHRVRRTVMDPSGAALAVLHENTERTAAFSSRPWRTAIGAWPKVPIGMA